jgi:DNA-binding response OmpR family regulator
LSTKKPTVLVVDDEESNAEIVSRALAIAGYEVDSTTISTHALSMIENRHYDAVVADVRMPALSGPEFYARACAMRPQLVRRFIFVTGDIDGKDTLEFLARSQCGYFMKPFNLERLIAAVDMLVAGDPEASIG